MDKANIYKSNHPAPLYNPPIYIPPNHDNNNSSSFVKLDSNSPPNPQPYPKTIQPNYPFPPTTNLYNGSLLSQENPQYQSNGTQLATNGTTKSHLGTSEQKYKNKYSFKGNTVAKSSLVPDDKTGRAEQSRSFTINEQKIQNNTSLYDNKEIAGNTLNQLSNIINQNPNIFTPRPRPRPSSNINNVQTNFIPTPLNVVIPPPSPNRPPLIIPVNPQPSILPPHPIVIPAKPQPQPLIIPVQPIVVPFVPQPNIKPSQPQQLNPLPVQPPQNVPSQVVPTVIPQPVKPVVIPEFVDKSQKYIKQIRELRLKIEELESQKLHLIDQVRYYERQRFQATSEQTLRIYKEQIETLKKKITQISASVPPPPPSYPKNVKQIEQLKEKLASYINREKEYEHQLIQAQNHIIYLQNASKTKPSVSCSHEHFENEIKYLRQTIANYTEHLDHTQLEKQEYKKYIVGKDQELNRLYEQNSILNNHIQQLQKTNPTENGGIDPNQYYSLLAQFGKKDLQVIILMQEISRLEKQSLETKAFLVKAEDYIIELQQQVRVATSGHVGNTDHIHTQELQLAVQKEQEKQAALNYEAKILNLNTLNAELLNQINIYQTEITTYKTTHTTTTVQGVDNQVYEALLIQFGKKQLQTIVLLQEINRLNNVTKQVTTHLQNAEEYIFNIQQHVKILEARLNGAPQTNTSSNPQVESLKWNIKDLQGKLVALQTRQATHFKEVQALQLKYKAIISQLNKNYNEVLSQKNSLTQKLANLQRQSTKVAGSNVPSRKFIQLEETNKKLTIQIAEITEHLVRAEAHIKMNTQKWQKGQSIEKELPEKVSTIELLNKEIQLIKDQNVRLNESNIQLQGTVQHLSNSQSNGQNMTIVIRQMEEVEVLEADRHAQIEQLELSLANYTTLYNQSQAKLAAAQKQIAGYKVQIKKFGELEGYLRKAEQFITEQELKWNADVKNYETENTQIKNHLIGAQIHIKELEERLVKLNTDYLKIQQQNKAHIKENHQIVQALNKAQKHIYEMEKLK